MTELTVAARHASVVLVSPSPVDSQAVRPERLVIAQVVPKEWVLASELSIPPLAAAHYQNGISIRIEGNRVVFQEMIGPMIRESYEVHQLARRYLEATKLTPYTAVGVNWLLELVADNPTDWLRKFLGDRNEFSGFAPIGLQVAKQVGLSMCNLNLRVENTEPPVLLLDCNYHFHLSEGLNPLATLDHWRNCQERLTSEVMPLIQLQEQR